MLQGGCFCGAMRYEVNGQPFNRSACHCSICRRTSGAPMVGWFSVWRTQFRWLHGEPTQFRSSSWATRAFCTTCGTQLTFASDEFPDEIDLTIASLDNPNAVMPHDHIHASSMLVWVKPADGLPAFAGSREQG